MSQHASNGLWQQLGDFLADVPQAVATHLDERACDEEGTEENRA